MVSMVPKKHVLHGWGSAGHKSKKKMVQTNGRCKRHPSKRVVLPIDERRGLRRGKTPLHFQKVKLPKKTRRITKAARKVKLSGSKMSNAAKKAWASRRAKYGKKGAR